VIPGNHDVRYRGNKIPGVMDNTYEFVVDVSWQPFVVDDDMLCVFFCFNSAESGNLAKGCVTDSQLERVASCFDEERARRLKRDGRRGRDARDLDTYTKIALVHHHPYQTVPSTGYDILLRRDHPRRGHIHEV
jgi:hypothetical protein